MNIDQPGVTRSPGEVEVAATDEEAAKDYFQATRGHRPTHVSDTLLAEAFARHRLAASRTPDRAASAQDGEREAIAEIIYEAMAWAAARRESGKPPAWVPGGNSDAQFEARRTADRIAVLRAVDAPPNGGEDRQKIIGTWPDGSAMLGYEEATPAIDPAPVFEEIELASSTEAMVCAGCGSTRTIASIRAEHPNALSCCPERKMVRASELWAQWVATIDPAPDVQALVEALKHIAASGYGLQGIQEDYGHDTNAYNFHAMKYWAGQTQRRQQIATVALASFKAGSGEGKS